MSNSWMLTKLSELLQPVSRPERVDPTKEYRLLGVRLDGAGPFHRETIQGSQSAATTLYEVKSGDFIYSRLFACRGAFGIVNSDLDGCYVSGEFPTFVPVFGKVNVNFLKFWFRLPTTIREVVTNCSGSTPLTRNRFKENFFLNLEIQLPLVEEQRRIVAKIDEVASKINEANELRSRINDTSRQLLQSAFSKVIANAKLSPMHEVAPITRRPVNVDLFSVYPELGIRSFGNGTFHKPPLSGAAVGGKKLFRIEPGNIVFNNVFAWEGAVAVAKAEDFGRFGSHRFITCLPKKGLATPEFLCFYFLTSKGLEKLGEASPGGAGRNRTLGLDALSKIEVPIPPIDQQLWFDSLQKKVESLKMHQEQTSTQLAALLPSILNKAFKGVL
jgi:type I restriction enzyme S subunit